MISLHFSLLCWGWGVASIGSSNYCSAFPSDELKILDNSWVSPWNMRLSVFSFFHLTRCSQSSPPMARRTSFVIMAQGFLPWQTSTLLPPLGSCESCSFEVIPYQYLLESLLSVLSGRCQGEGLLVNVLRSHHCLPLQLCHFWAMCECDHFSMSWPTLADFWVGVLDLSCCFSVWEQSSCVCSDSSWLC